MQMIETKNKTIKFSWYRNFIKRFLDIIFSLIALVVLAIPMLIIALCIKVDSKDDPIMFKQTRVGKNGMPFKIFKFRTMRTNAPHEMATENFDNPEKYITRVGHYLRKSSLDELPQLINVIKGDMSIIGPRPLITEEKNVLGCRREYGADKILPGITGLAQVHGRDELTGRRKAFFDGEYAHNVSLGLDIRIFLKTISDVLQSKGIHEGSKHDKNKKVNNLR